MNIISLNYKRAFGGWKNLEKIWVKGDNLVGR